jgi:YD repeat-containing protein
VYDANDNLVRDIDADPTGNTTTYFYDPVNRLAGGTREDNQGAITSYLYDVNANQIRSYEPLGPQVTTYLYDSRGGQLIGAYEDGNGTHGYVAPIPEPASLALLLTGAALGAVCLARRRAR